MDTTGAAIIGERNRRECTALQLAAHNRAEAEDLLQLALEPAS
jgi:hypothetical protein